MLMLANIALKQINIALMLINIVSKQTNGALMLINISLRQINIALRLINISAPSDLRSVSWRATADLIGPFHARVAIRPIMRSMVERAQRLPLR